MKSQLSLDKLSENGFASIYPWLWVTDNYESIGTSLNMEGLSTRPWNNASQKHEL